MSAYGENGLFEFGVKKTFEKYILWTVLVTKIERKKKNIFLPDTDFIFFGFRLRFYSAVSRPIRTAQLPLPGHTVNTEVFAHFSPCIYYNQYV